MTEYKTIQQEATGEITEKKSRFIATLRPVSSEEEALAFIAEMKKKYWDARHNCSAYIIGTDKPLERCSDDGEPSRTAGMPMLEVLKGSGLSNVCAVVTRYFGGILLGTGGLVRAYQAATAEGIRNSVILTCKYLNRIKLTLDYTAYGKVQYYAVSEHLSMDEPVFSDSVSVTFSLSDEERGKLLSYATEATSGKAGIEDLGKSWVTVLT
ncbi:MAG: YigZ family protein [Lachnospiraceae bacterium]|nr:YigZ family protein [Lachnospiraceae bacterium]